MKITSLFTKFLLMLSIGIILPAAQAQTPLLTPPSSHERHWASMPLGQILIDGKPLFLPVIPVRLSDTENRLFVLDIGANTSLLTDKMAAKMGLTPEPAVKDSIPYRLKGKQAQMVKVPVLQFGLFSTPNVALLLTPAKELEDLLGNDIAGVIGTNIQKKFAIVLDFSAKRATFYSPSGLSLAEREAIGFSDARTLPLTETSDGLYTVETTFRKGTEQVKATLRLDTGAVTTRITSRLAKQLHLQPQGKPVSKGGFNGSPLTNTATVDSLLIGPLFLAGQAIDYPAEDDGLPGLLGMDILSKYRILIDHAPGGNTLYLLPQTIGSKQ